MHGLTVLCQELDAAMTAGKLLLPTMDLLVLLQYRLRLEALLTFVAVEGSVGGHVIRQIVEAPPALLTARSIFALLLLLLITFLHFLLIQIASQQ